MAGPVRVQGGMPQVTVSQSTMVALALFVLFLVYITAKGELQNYLAVLFGTVSTTASGTGSTGTTATSSVQSALNMAQQGISAAQQVSGLLSGGGGNNASVYGQAAAQDGGTVATDSAGNVIGADFGGGGDFGATGAITGGSSTGGLF